MQQQNIYLSMTSRNTNRPNLHTQVFKIITKIQIVKNLFQKLAHNEHTKCNWGIIVSFCHHLESNSHLLVYYIHIILSLSPPSFSSYSSNCRESIQSRKHYFQIQFLFPGKYNTRYKDSFVGLGTLFFRTSSCQKDASWKKTTTQNTSVIQTETLCYPFSEKQ